MRFYGSFSPLGLLGAITLLLVGCSATQIAYKNADSLLTRYAVSELDLNREQKQQLGTRLGEWMVWHRSEQVPVLHARLSAVQRAVADGMDHQEAAWLIATARGTYREVLAGLNPISVDTLLSLSDEQIGKLQDSFQDDNQEFREDVLAGDPVERREDRFEWFSKQLERWIGDLTDPQSDWLRMQLQRYPSTADQWLVYRQRQQSQLLDLLRQRGERSDLLGFLNGWIIERRGLPERYAHSRQRIYAELPERLVELDQLLTQRQRRHLVKRIQFFEEVVASLILVPEAQARGD